jgi:septum formation protein
MPRRPQLLLASSSPRRRELLAQIGVSFQVLPINVDEARHEGEAAQAYVQRLALEKAQAGWGRASGDLPVLGADTVIELDGTILGKPVDKTEALAMLEALSGRSHFMYTGVAMVARERHAQRLSCTRVQFRDINAREREAYWASGEPLGKAAAYAIQGRAAVFVKALHGSCSGVIGLPLFETAILLSEFGIPVV